MPSDNPPAERGLFARLAKARRGFAEGLAGLFGAGKVDEALLDELHDQLLLADVGVEAGEKIIAQIRRNAGRQSGAQVLTALREALTEVLSPCEKPLQIDAAIKPFVVLLVGVNGSGKTTTAAKVAAQLQADGNKVMLAACDTFRAAAIEQLQTWGARLGMPVVAQTHGADAAAVAFDAYNSACARGVDALLIDTAGRQHTHGDLMAQLQKIRRVLGKAETTAPHETLLVVDGGHGYNALSQAAHFHDGIGLTGLCITKLDGSAKGGAAVALAEKFGLPIRYLCTGQEPTDIRVFAAAEFANALLPRSQ